MDVAVEREASSRFTLRGRLSGFYVVAGAPTQRQNCLAFGRHSCWLLFGLLTTSRSLATPKSSLTGSITSVISTRRMWKGGKPKHFCWPASSLISPSDISPELSIRRRMSFLRLHLVMRSADSTYSTATEARRALPPTSISLNLTRPTALDRLCDPAIPCPVSCTGNGGCFFICSICCGFSDASDVCWKVFSPALSISWRWRSCTYIPSSSICTLLAGGR
jgi:hypothetical protein